MLSDAHGGLFFPRGGLLSRSSVPKFIRGNKLGDGVGDTSMSTSLRQPPPRPWSPHKWWMGLTGTASGAPYATLWATYYRHGFEVSYNIMALTDAASFLRRACGAQVACASANDRPSISSSPPIPTMDAIFTSWGGLGDDGLPSFYTAFNVKRSMWQWLAGLQISMQLSRHFPKLVSGKSGCCGKLSTRCARW